MKKALIITLTCILGLSSVLNATLTYDARIEGRERLTPLASDAPRINTPEVYGCTPSKPLVYRIPTQGVRPMHFTADGLPDSVHLDGKTGILTGTTPEAEGNYTIVLKAENEFGSDSMEWTLVVGDTLSLTPSMGWNHWYTHYHYVTDKTIREATDAMVSSGLADVGYSYVSIDDCWMKIEQEYVDAALRKGHKYAGRGNFGLDKDQRTGKTRNEDGTIIPNIYFPDMPALTEYIHDKGLKAGIYTSPGPRTCQEFEGSWQHEAIDADTYARWGFDLLKYDLCRYREILAKLPEEERASQKAHMEPYLLMGELLRGESRDILLNLCQYGFADVWTWGKQAGQSWRTGGDLGHTLLEGGVYDIAKKTIEIREYNGPGGWNDPDYLILGNWRYTNNKAGPIEPVQLTADEQYSYFSLWCMMACPLFFSGDMASMDDFTTGLLCNTEMIAVNQDRLGLCADPAEMNDAYWVLKKNLADGSWVIGVFDVANAGDQEIDVDLKAMGLAGTYDVRDLWRQKDIGEATESMKVQVNQRGCAIFKIIEQ